MLQSGYNFYSFDKDSDLIKDIEEFRKEKSDYDTSFFSRIKQDTCEVYPYWPRAFTLEIASFFISKKSWTYIDFHWYKEYIMTLRNIKEQERDENFWNWVREFPHALQEVMEGNDFNKYLSWEESWISHQNKLWETELQSVQKTLDICKQSYGSQVTKIHIILTPIKCTYSPDYFKKENDLFFILGTFRIDSIIHECLHHDVHPIISKYTQVVLNHTLPYPGIDRSYYLNGDANGKLNAFEEYIVCRLTDEILKMKFTLDLDEYILGNLKNLE
ncbi:MAG: hypothetical protein GX077_04360 [Tissierellia bacterium]|nr:hypothetical protein [Tissierellia bacterium]